MDVDRKTAVFLRWMSGPRQVKTKSETGERRYAREKWRREDLLFCILYCMIKLILLSNLVYHTILRTS